MEIGTNDDSGDDLNLAQVMARIRSEAQKRKLVSYNHTSPIPYKHLLAQGADVPRLSSARITDSLLPDLKIQPELERREQYQVRDLLDFHDEAFVRNCYLVVLKREPDDAGFAKYLENLRGGRYSKMDILRSIRFSAEGRKTNVSIKGLGRSVSFRKLYRAPGLGYVLQFVVAIVRLPILIANYRRLESYTAAQLERVATHLNETVACFSEEQSASRRQSEAHQEQLDALKSTVRLQISSLIREQRKTVREQDALNSNLLARFDAAAEQARQQEEDQDCQTAALQGLKSQIEERIENLIERLQNARMDIVQQETRLAILLEDTRNRMPDAFHHDQLQTLKTEEDHLLDSLYCSLEDALRGTPDEIREQVKLYLPVLKNAGITSGILDIGCGRGEWLEVLREAGVQARGIDQNRILIQQCKASQLDVVESEALTFLRTVGDGSLNAVTAFHFAEHLSLKTLVRFLDEVARTLRPGGLVILETPNPENLLVGSCNFYLDPTHKNPIPLATMKLLLEARGFCCQEVLKLHPVSSARIEVKDQLTSHLNHYLYGPMNYAVVARKPENTFL